MGEPTHAGPIPEGGGAPLPEVPSDQFEEDTRIPIGEIRLHVADEKDHPIPRWKVTLNVLRQSISQGDARSRTEAETDDVGDVVFSGLKSGTGWSYSIFIEGSSADGSVTAKYGSPPIMLPLSHGYRGLLHRFPVASSIDGLMVAVGGVDTGIEIRDDVVEIQQTFEIINAGATSWGLGQGLLLKLPSTSKAFRAPDPMGDMMAVPVENSGVKWVGSFQPGTTTLSYDYKLPYDGEATVDAEIELPPRVLAARVRLAARREMTLDVDGFPAGALDTSGLGVHVLQTVKRGDPKDPIRSLKIHVRGLPQQGPEKWIATALGLSGVVLGFVLAYGTRSKNASHDPERRKRRRRYLLDELLTLEQAKQRDQVGPRGYERERARLIDALADALDEVPADAPTPYRTRTEGDAKKASAKKPQSDTQKRR